MSEPPTKPCHVFWCRHDIPTDGVGVLHISNDTAVGPLHVSLEQLDRSTRRPGTPAIRIVGDDEPITPLQALGLSLTLQVEAISALLGRGA